MSNVTCVPCERKYKIKKNSVVLMTMFDKPPKPYELYYADLWKCPGCGHEIISGVSQEPIIEHWEPEFSDILTQIMSRFIPIVKQYEA